MMTLGNQYDDHCWIVAAGVRWRIVRHWRSLSILQLESDYVVPHTNWLDYSTARMSDYVAEATKMIQEWRNGEAGLHS